MHQKGMEPSLSFAPKTHDYKRITVEESYAKSLELEKECHKCIDEGLRFRSVSRRHHCLRSRVYSLVNLEDYVIHIKRSESIFKIETLEEYCDILSDQGLSVLLQVLDIEVNQALGLNPKINDEQYYKIMTVLEHLSYHARVMWEEEMSKRATKDNVSNKI